MNWFLYRDNVALRKQVAKLAPMIGSLTNITSKSTFAPSETFVSAPTNSTPLFVTAPMGTYLTLQGRYRAIFGDYDVGVGDYCPYGLILAVRDGSCICRGDSGLIIVRGSFYSSGATAAPAEAAPEEVKPLFSI